MATNVVWLATGAIVSSQMNFDGRGSKLAIFINSHGPNGYFIAFAQTSGGPFHRLQNPTGTGAGYAVFSGGGTPAVAIVQRASQWGRMEANSGMTTTTSITVVELTGIA